MDGAKLHTVHKTGSTYYLKNYRRNNQVVTDKNGNAEEANYYYPFGGIAQSIGNVQPYKYNGEELDRENRLNWYNYGAREYDVALGRWHDFVDMVQK
ncbi:RHS repeat-associated core domain-containing protein [Bacteroides sp.]|uniref:RHS repeat-associated core domain-containing protein n=1 Tax=Bacteroides sp. TaxID=29523 RepID=UPI00345D50EF